MKQPVIQNSFRRKQNCVERGLGRSGTFREYISRMKNRPHEPQPQAPTDGPLTRLIDDQDQGENLPPAQSLPQPPEAGSGRDDYGAGTPEHDDDREL